METSNSAIPERTLWQICTYYASIFWRYRLITILITGLVTLGAIVYSIVSLILPPEKSYLPNFYSAEAAILVQGGGQGDIAGSILAALGVADQRSMPSSTMRDNGDMIIQILNSRYLLDRLTAEFKLNERYNCPENAKTQMRKMVQGNTQINYLRTAGTLKIAYTDIDPVFAKNVANRMVSLLDEWFSLNRGMAKQKQRQILEEKINEVKTAIASLQSRIKRLQTQYGVLDVQGLSQSQATTIASLRSQLILKEIDIMNYSSFSKIDDPRLEQLKEERQNLLDLISQNQLKLPDSRQGENGASEGASSRPNNLLDVAQEFSQLNIELDIQQRIYNTLSPQYEAMKLAPESEAAFQVLELADVPDMKAGPKRSIIIFKAFGMSLAASLALSYILNFVRTNNSKSQRKHSGEKETVVI
jgi:tyrosine-protein kinase Etk/Wzc